MRGTRTLLAGLLLLACVTAAGCPRNTSSGSSETNSNVSSTLATDKPLWTQVFTTWTCTAPGRPEWKWSAAQKSDYSDKHEWTDLSNGTTDVAVVLDYRIYLQQGGEAFRNFDFTEKPDHVLDHLEETAVTAVDENPYICNRSG